MAAMPSSTPVTVPLDETRATLLFVEYQVNVVVAVLGETVGVSVEVSPT